MDGIRATLPTSWEPGSKPIWFTEIGCAAVDKATNEPNRFIDPKSSESGLPRASNGIRDDYIQMQYLRAIYQHYSDEDLNPTSDVTGLRMVDPERIHVWAWDARPFPAFPGNETLWADSANYSRGHWINGRAASRSLSSVVAEICEAIGISQFDVSELHGLVRGYGVADVSTGRAALQPLMVAYGFDAIERDGVLVFRTRDARIDANILEERMVYEAGTEGAIELIRSQDIETAGRVRLGFIESDANYEMRTSEAIFPDDRVTTTSMSEVPLVLTSAEGQRVAERWLAESRVARDTARFALPPSLMNVGVGDVVRLPDEKGDGLFRIDQSELTDRQTIEAVRVEPAVYDPQDVSERTFDLHRFVAPVPVELMMLDLPLLNGDEDPVAPFVAASGIPWPGSVALYSSSHDSDYRLNGLLTSPSTMGLTQTVLPSANAGVYDRGASLRVELIRGDLASVSGEQLLSGANLAVIGDGTADNWEVFQFQDVGLVSPNTYELSNRLRGQAGTDGIMPAEWPVGSVFLMLDGTPEQIDFASAARGVSRHYRFGPGTRPITDASYQHREEVFTGIGLRPYRVAHMSFDIENDAVMVAWIRRTRLNGDSWGPEDVPLSEAFERYAVRVFSNGIQVRNAVTTSAEWTYSEEMRQIDGTLGAANLRFDVAQISDIYGEGPAASISVQI